MGLNKQLPIVIPEVVDSKADALIDKIIKDYPEFESWAEYLESIIEDNYELNNNTGVYSVTIKYVDDNGYIDEISEFILNFIPKLLINKKILNIKKDIIIKNVVCYVLGILYSDYKEGVIDDDNVKNVLEEMIIAIIKEILMEEFSYNGFIKDDEFSYLLEQVLDILHSKILTLSGFLYSTIVTKIDNLYEKGLLNIPLNNYNLVSDLNIVFSLIEKSKLKMQLQPDGKNTYVFDLIFVVHL